MLDGHIFKFHEVVNIANSKGYSKNLNPVHSEDEARLKGHNGGIQSGISKRRKKNAQEKLQMLFNLSVDERTKQQLKNLGVDDEDCNIQVAMFVASMQKAMKGDYRALDTLERIAGEMPTQILENEKFKHETDQEEHGNNIVDEWIQAIPDDGENE